MQQNARIFVGHLNKDTKIEQPIQGKAYLLISERYCYEGLACS